MIFELCARIIQIWTVFYCHYFHQFLDSAYTCFNPPPPPQGRVEAGFWVCRNNMLTLNILILVASAKVQDLVCWLVLGEHLHVQFEWQIIATKMSSQLTFIVCFSCACLKSLSCNCVSYTLGTTVFIIVCDQVYCLGDSGSIGFG